MIYEEISLIKLTLLYFLLTFLIGIIIIPMFAGTIYISMLYSSIVSIFILIWFKSKLSYIYEDGIKEYFNDGVKKTDSKKLKIILSIIITTNIMSIIYVYINYYYFDFSLYPEFMRDNIIETLEEARYLLDKQTNFYIILEITAVVIIAPIIEEIIFRGILFNKLKKRISIKLIAILLSLVFAILHPQNPIGAFIFSLCLFYIMAKYNDLLLCIAIHFFNNLIALFIGYAVRIFDFGDNIQYNHNLYLPIILSITVTIIFIMCYRYIRPKNALLN